MVKTFDTLRRVPVLQLFTVYLRFLIGGAFILAAFSMGKLSDHSATSGESFPINESTPGMMLFFKAIIESGLYWKFIGWTQIIAGGLLMTQRYAKLGAVIFFGIILNIFIITVSYDFKGTPIVAGLMLLATLYLLLWDAKSFQFLFRREGVLKYDALEIADNNFWVWIGIFMIASIVLLTLFKIKIFLILFIIFIEGVLALPIFFIKKKLDQKKI